MLNTESNALNQEIFNMIILDQSNSQENNLKLKTILSQFNIDIEKFSGIIELFWIDIRDYYKYRLFDDFNDLLNRINKMTTDIIEINKLSHDIDNMLNIIESYNLEENSNLEQKEFNKSMMLNQFNFIQSTSYFEA